MLKKYSLFGLRKATALEFSSRKYYLSKTCRYAGVSRSSVYSGAYKINPLLALATGELAYSRGVLGLEVYKKGKLIKSYKFDEDEIAFLNNTNPLNSDTWLKIGVRSAVAQNQIFAERDIAYAKGVYLFRIFISE